MPVHRHPPCAARRTSNAFLRVPYVVHGKDHPQYVYPAARPPEAVPRPRRRTRSSATPRPSSGSPATTPASLVGRIAAAVDAVSNEYHHEQVGYFGFYECLPDDEAAAALLATARAWIAGRGMTTMRGPGCFTTNHDYLGLLVAGPRRAPGHRHALATALLPDAVRGLRPRQGRRPLGLGRRPLQAGIPERVAASPSASATARPSPSAASA